LEEACSSKEVEQLGISWENVRFRVFLVKADIYGGVFETLDFGAEQRKHLLTLRGSVKVFLVFARVADRANGC